MKSTVLTLFLLFIITPVCQAQLIFRGQFEVPDIDPLFPVVAGEIQLPDEPTANQLQWILDQLAADDTSISDINNHFSDNWLGQIDATATRNFIQAVRNDYPDAKIIDLVGLSPMEANVRIQGQDNQANLGILTLSTFYSGAAKINGFGVTAHNGNLQYPDDMTLSLSEAINKFSTYSEDSGLLIAYINDDNVCEVIEGNRVNDVFATGSLFKPWILGGFAQSIQDTTMSLNQNIEYVASERVYNTSPMHREPFGTMFKALDVATLMLGNSDNTATDLLHEAVGRSVVDNYIASSGVIDPTILSPLLSVNEQFHLFFSFALATVQNYLADTEANQLDFINDQIVPLGPVDSFPFNNDSLLTSGSWRASPMDVCANMAKLRTYPKGSDALYAVDRSFGAQAALFNIRPVWDRVWYKGGSLVSGISGYKVLTHAWMLENNGQWPIVVVAMSNDDNGGIDDDLGIFRIQSVLSRIHQLLSP